MLKYILVTLFALISINSYALDPTAGFSTDLKNIFSNIEENLDVKLNNENKITLAKFLNREISGNWNLQPLENKTSLADNKFKELNVSFYNLFLSNKNRTNKLSFIYFKDVKQIHLTIEETIPSSIDNTLKFYNDTKADENYETAYETDSYSLFREKGKVSFSLMQIRDNAGVIVHSSSFILDL